MKRTLPLLLILALPLCGCMIPAGVAATAWATVKTAVKIVQVVKAIVPDNPEPENEEHKGDQQ